jgi:hypothetical protein
MRRSLGTRIDAHGHAAAADGNEHTRASAPLRKDRIHTPERCHRPLRGPAHRGRQQAGDAIWLQRAKANAQKLIAIHTESAGAWWFPYTFDWTYYDRTLTAPWWSGMAQGQVLSLFSRLAGVDPSGPWRNAADHTWLSFKQEKTATGPWSTVIIDSYLWFEEYAGNQPPLQVLNGHLFATFGLWDYWNLTGDPETAAYIDGAATTVLAHMDEIRVPGGPSYYCVQPNYCQSPDWQNAGYHPVHIWQLRTMARLTGDVRFAEWADLLASDFTLN